MTPDGLSLGLLVDLLVAWAEGEVSEGFVVKVTGLDRFDLRGLKLASIRRALAHADKWAAEHPISPVPPLFASNGGSGPMGPT